MKKFLSLLVGVIFLLALTVIPASAFIPLQPPVCVFWGKVNVDQKPAPTHLKVSAWINGKKVAETSIIKPGTKKPEYCLRIVQPEDKYFEGKELKFKIGRDLAVERGIWRAGRAFNLDLNAVTNPKLPNSLFSIKDKYEIVWGFNEFKKEWKFYCPEATDEINNLEKLKEGEDYWIKIKKKKELKVEVEGETVKKMIKMGRITLTFGSHDYKLRGGWNHIKWRGR